MSPCHPSNRHNLRSFQPLFLLLAMVWSLIRAVYLFFILPIKPHAVFEIMAE